MENENKTPLRHALPLAIAPALVSSIMTGLVAWGLAVRDAKHEAEKGATEKDQVVFTTLRDRIAELESSVGKVAGLVSDLARKEKPRAARVVPQPAKPAGDKQEPTAKIPEEEQRPDQTTEQERKILLDVLDRIKNEIPRKPLPARVQDIPSYAPSQKP